MSSDQMVDVRPLTRGELENMLKQELADWQWERVKDYVRYREVPETQDEVLIWVWSPILGVYKWDLTLLDRENTRDPEIQVAEALQEIQNNMPPEYRSGWIYFFATANEVMFK